jgi:hypothetical protein
VETFARNRPAPFLLACAAAGFAAAGIFKAGWRASFGAQRSGAVLVERRVPADAGRAAVCGARDRRVRMNERDGPVGDTQEPYVIRPSGQAPGSSGSAGSRQRRRQCRRPAQAARRPGLAPGRTAAGLDQGGDPRVHHRHQGGRRRLCRRCAGRDRWSRSGADGPCLSALRRHRQPRPCEP